MRFVAAVAILVPILVAAWVLAREPRPESRAQAAARHAADSLARIEPAAGPGEVAGRAWTGATRRGRLAWAAVEPGGGTGSPAWRTAAWLLRDGQWRPLVGQSAEAPTWEELQAGAALGRFTAPPALPATEGRDAERLARRFRRALAHFGRIRPDRQAIAVGPAYGGPAVGDSAVGALFSDLERRLGAPRLAADGLRAIVPRRTGVGWVAANLEVTPPGWGGATLPLRFTGVYRSRGEESWALVLAHLSVAVPHRADVPPTPAP